jgi:hypothetical protein
MARQSKAAAKAMKTNAERVQAWFDADTRYHHADREFHGTTIPKAVLRWGGTSAEPLVLRFDQMPKGHLRKAEWAMTVFWDIDPSDTLKCLSTIVMPELCITCGTSKDLKMTASPFGLIQTIPETTSHYKTKSGFGPFGVRFCPDHYEATPHLRVAHQDKGRFLTVNVGRFGSTKAYRAFVEANASHMIPEVEAVYTARIPNDKIASAIRKLPK